MSFWSLPDGPGLVSELLTVQKKEVDAQSKRREQRPNLFCTDFVCKKAKPKTTELGDSLRLATAPSSHKSPFFIVSAPTFPRFAGGFTSHHQCCPPLIAQIFKSNAPIDHQFVTCLDSHSFPPSMQTPDFNYCPTGVLLFTMLDASGGNDVLEGRGGVFST